MRQNATDQSGSELAPNQLRALSALATGSTVTAAAEHAGVDRTTLHRWIREDSGFQAAWNRLRGEIRRELTARLDLLGDAALGAVQTAILGGDTHVALTVLKGLGLLSGKPSSIGPEDAEEVAEEAELARDEAQAERTFRRIATF
jgi:hypothetical protein